MDEITVALRKLREENPDIDLMLEVFSKTQSIYSGAMNAMGENVKVTYTAKSSSEVTTSLQSVSSSLELKGS